MTLVYILIITFLVSYIPRVLPLVIIRKPIKSRFIKSFIYYVPSAVLATMTFPAIFYSTGNQMAAMITSAIVVVLSFFKVPAEAIIVISIVLAFVLSLFV